MPASTARAATAARYATHSATLPINPLGYYAAGVGGGGKVLRPLAAGAWEANRIALICARAIADLHSLVMAAPEVSDSHVSSVGYVQGLLSRRLHAARVEVAAQCAPWFSVQSN